MNRAKVQAVLFQTGSLAGAMVQEHDVGGGQLAVAQVDRDGDAVAGDGAALGPGDQVRTAIRADWGVHHAQNRDTMAQQPDRDRAAAASFQECAGAVMRIDDPAVAVRLGGQHTLFLADESGRQQFRQALAQKQFDLGIDRRRVVVAESRTIGPAELGGEPSASLLHEVDHGGKNRWQGCCRHETEKSRRWRPDTLSPLRRHG